MGIGMEEWETGNVSMGNWEWRYGSMRKYGEWEWKYGKLGIEVCMGE